MTKIVELIKNKPNTDMIEALEKVLVEAKSGNLRSLGVIYVTKERNVLTKSCNVDAKHELIAGCAYLQHDIIAATD